MPGKRRKVTDSETFIIMDDEKYFSFSGDNMPSNVGLWSCERERTSSEVKFKFKRKFAPKILVCLAISSKGISALHMETTKGSAINGGVYVKKCYWRLSINIIEVINISFGPISPAHITQRKQWNGLMSTTSPLYTEQLIHQTFLKQDQSTSSGQYWLIRCTTVVGRLLIHNN